MSKNGFYICNECGFKSIKWVGKCSNCGEWGTFDEEINSTSKNAVKNNLSMVELSNKVVSFSDIQLEKDFRYKTTISEFDRILGGGLVKGQVVLITGNPGIGKSTLLLQTAKEYTKYGDVLYISGEESPAQIKSRGERLGI
ncbi:MAG: ATPase domain-containing protein, partial [Cetobacterium sp.]